MALVASLGLGFLAAEKAALADAKHVVAPRETLSGIARKYGVSVSQLRKANRLKDANSVRIGQTLSIPGVRGAGRRTLRHVVSRRDTLSGIAHRYHVPMALIVHVNRIKNPGTIRPGTELTIPGAVPDGRSLPAETTADRAPAGVSSRYSSRARTPGVVHLRPVGSKLTYHIRVRDGQGHVSASARTAFRRALASHDGRSHAIDGRLIWLAGMVSDHFGSRTLHVVSGYRPHGSKRRRHSPHNLGHAMDFHVDGVPNEVVRDYCRHLAKAGVGYYPNSTFVHLDVRSASAYWVDLSGPGERARYVRFTTTRNSPARASRSEPALDAPKATAGEAEAPAEPRSMFLLPAPE